jgi:hypothetical protein
MPTELVTTDDLREFKTEILTEIKKLFKEHGQPAKKWLKSGEVRKLLGISPGTLQNLRVTGTLPFTKVGGTLYYDYQDVRKMLEENRQKDQLPFGRFR